MIRIDENIWIDGSGAGWRDVRRAKITAVLNVARDLLGTIGWPDVEYAQVGLVDGPGNLPADYCSAVSALYSLSNRHRTLVCCHTGSRSLAVVLMLSSIISSSSWDEALKLLNERVDQDLPSVHEAHREVFENTSWVALRAILR